LSRLISAITFVKKKIATFRFNLRIKAFNTTFFIMLSRSQTLNGFNSLVQKGATIPESQHIVMWDLEGCTLNEACKELSEIQDKFHLGEIYVVHDGTPRSYRAWCFTVVSFMRLLDILIHTRFVDWNFLFWTFHRAKSTLRITNKKGREPQHIVATIGEGYAKVEPIPATLEYVTYDTGISKAGVSVLLG
jgi:hypothetical protein